MLKSWSSAERWLGLALLLLLGLVAAAKPTGKTSLAFVLDTSKSMGTDLRRLAEWAAAVLPAKKAVLEKKFDHFLVTPFGGLHAKYPASTGNTSVFIETLKSLRVHSGDSCGKMVS